jgi:predicted amidohydrolase
MDQFRIALAQLKPRLFDKKANLAMAEKTISQASDNGAAVIVFPELFLTGYNLGSRAVELAESLDGPSARQIANLAMKYHIAVLMGFAERNQDLERMPFDSVLIVGSEGNIAGSYQKIHLFHSESRYFQAGSHPLVIDFGLGPTGILVCYDLEFPEAVRVLALGGACWIAACTGNMVPNQHLQEIFIQSRAAENRLWVAVANRTGSEGELTFFGESAVADPTGNLVTKAGGKDGIKYADIDLGASAKAKLNADYLADRRPEVYQRGNDGF